MESGEVHRGKIRPANRQSLRSWLEHFNEQFPEHEAAIAVEATTGWRYVIEELQRAGIEPHLAEPAETKSLQGRKKRAKTDRLDAGHLRDLMVIDRLPESWIPPQHIQEIRTLMRLRHSLIEERTTHKQRIHAQLFHNGYPQQKNLDSIEGRAHLEEMELPAAARQVVALSLKMIDHINEELEPIEAHLRAYAGSQAGCQALMEHYYGVGELSSVVALLSELGDTRRFSSSKKEGGALCRDGRNRPQLRREASGGQAQPTGAAGIEVGCLRGSQESLEERLTRSRLLRAQQGAHRSQSGGSIHRAQADPASTPHLTGAGRGGYERASAHQWQCLR
jgi:transposase